MNVLNGLINTLDLGKDVCDGLNKIVLFYGNKNCLIFTLVKIEAPPRLEKASKNVRKGMVLV
jgi:hypothetical protein